MTENIVNKKQLGAALRCMLYEINFRKSTVDEQYKILCHYDKNINIRDEKDPWNVVDLTQCNLGVIHAAKIKAEIRLRNL